MQPPSRIDGFDCSAVPLVGALGEHARDLLESVLGVDARGFAALAAAGAFGATAAG